jgi:hypothetical protein
MGNIFKDWNMWFFGLKRTFLYCPERKACWRGEEAIGVALAIFFASNIFYLIMMIHFPDCPNYDDLVKSLPCDGDGLWKKFDIRGVVS